MSTSNGMVRVLGTTYRIFETSGMHEVVRLLDNMRVGSFRYQTTLTILESSIDRRLLADVMREALRGGKLGWPAQSPAHFATKWRAFLSNAIELLATPGRFASARLASRLPASLITPGRLVPVRALRRQASQYVSAR